MFSRQIVFFHDLDRFDRAIMSESEDRGLNRRRTPKDRQARISFEVGRSFYASLSIPNVSCRAETVMSLDNGKPEKLLSIEMGSLWPGYYPVFLVLFHCLSFYAWHFSFSSLLVWFLFFFCLVVFLLFHCVLFDLFRLLYSFLFFVSIHTGDPRVLNRQDDLPHISRVHIHIVWWHTAELPSEPRRLPCPRGRNSFGP